MKQWKVVLVAFLTAATFWFFNALGKQYTTNLNYPVEFVFDHDSLISTKHLPTSIELDVSGGGWGLLKRTAIFSPEPIKIKIQNPINVKTLTWIEILPVVRDQIKDLTVNQILADPISINIEPKTQRWVRPIIDSVKISLEDNFKIISSLVIDRDSILLEGPKSFIDTLAQVYLFPITEQDINKDFDKLVDVQVLSPLIKSEPEQVNVKFEVGELLSKNIRVKIIPLNFPADSSVYLSTGETLLSYVTFKFQDQEFMADDFRVVADMDSLNADSTIDIQLVSWPREIHNVKLNEKRLNVVFSD